MNLRRVWVVLSVFLLVGCSLTATTSDRATDPEAVQNYLPTIQGYTSTDASSVTSALAAISGGASLLSGNPVLAAVVAKIDNMIQCYQSVGAVTARIYTQASIDITNPEIPAAGALALINQERLRDNFLACALGGQTFSAQAAGVEPCFGSGDFKAGTQTISYLYAATRPELCGLFQQHFNALSRR